jgi:hypothetical protein
MPTSLEARHWLGFSSLRNLPELAAAVDAPEPELEVELVCARAGAARRAVVTRHAAMCFFSMFFLHEGSCAGKESRLHALTTGKACVCF